MRGESNPQRDEKAPTDAEEPTQQEYNRLQSLLKELDELSKKPWAQAAINGVILGPTRLMQEGLRKIVPEPKDSKKSKQD
jgi:hypothetical protein